MYIVPQKFGAVVVFRTIEVFIEIRKYDYRPCTCALIMITRRSFLREVKCLFGVFEKFSEIVTPKFKLLIGKIDQLLI